MKKLFGFEKVGNMAEVIEQRIKQGDVFLADVVKYMTSEIAELQDKLKLQELKTQNAILAHDSLQKIAIGFKETIHRRNLQIADLKKKLKCGACGSKDIIIKCGRCFHST